MHIISKGLLEPSLQLIDYQFSGNVRPQPMEYGNSDTSSADKTRLDHKATVPPPTENIN